VTDGENATNVNLKANVSWFLTIGFSDVPFLSSSNVIGYLAEEMSPEKPNISEVALCRLITTATSDLLLQRSAAI